MSWNTRKIKAGITRLFRKARAAIKRQREKTFISRLVKSLPLILLGLVFIVYFSRTELYTKFEMSFLDTQMRTDNPLNASDVIIVEITEDDFKTIFESRTHPLNPPKLQQLITAVSAGKPCVIGVDIGTDFSEFSNKDYFQIQDEWSPIVWVRDTKDILPDTSKKPIPTEVLGGQVNPNLNSGLPLLIDDSQGVTRKYKRIIETEKGELPIFAWAVYLEAAKQKCAGIEFPDQTKIDQRQKETSSLFIKYSRGNPNQTIDDSSPNKSKSSNQNSTDKDWNQTDYFGRIKIPASQIIEFAKSVEWQNNELIKDKIVLIGGSYDEDIHNTPLGKMWGVEIMANVVESELRGGGIKPPGVLITALLAVFDGFLLLGLFHIFPWHKAFLIGIAALFMLSFVCSFLAFGSFSYWILFAPVMFGILLAEFFDRVKDYLKDHYQKELAGVWERIKHKPKKESDSQNK